MFVWIFYEEVLANLYRLFIARFCSFGNSTLLAVRFWSRILIKPGNQQLHKQIIENFNDIAGQF
jgi:hypothetical protein